MPCSMDHDCEAIGASALAMLAELLAAIEKKFPTPKEPK